MDDICMLRHSKSVMSMTFVCLGIAKLECQISLGNSFLSLISSCMIYLKRKICKEKSKAKKSKMLLNMITSVYYRRCGSYRMYLEGDSPHQVIMIVCELKRLSHTSNRHNMIHLCNLAIFFTHNTQYSLLFLIHVQRKCDLAITSFTCGNVCSLNCRDLFLKYKIG